ncbi:beta-glucosidase 44-like [Andrographis paniculata]|uniref:beta-glucosidase 44-like n=1 Tax=Andrographis paniculata TaxID=175694 RepID=UPI0021E892DB|nr:beta-glucosidase 44-like [Andrographis paniculata]
MVRRNLSLNRGRDSAPPLGRSPTPPFDGPIEPEQLLQSLRPMAPSAPSSLLVLVLVFFFFAITMVILPLSLLALPLSDCSSCPSYAAAEAAPSTTTITSTEAEAEGDEQLKRSSFPKSFIFGTASSAYQVEGAANQDGRGPSIWDTFLRQPGLQPNNGTADVTADQYHRYKEDLDLMADFNFDAYRFSISWSRIFPNGTGEVNWKGVDYYNRLINYMLEKGITPYPNLNHYDLPQALQDRYGGWLNRHVVKDFADYADFCFKTFGDRVKNWQTFNEPRVVAALGYDNGLFAPGRCSKAFGNCTEEGNSGTEPYIVAHNLILCHASAAQRYRQKYQQTQKGRIGILLDFTWYEPLTRSKADNYAAQRARDFHLGWFLHPLVYGEYPKTMQNIVGERLPKFTKEEVGMVKGSADFVGLNQYTSFYIYDPRQANTAAAAAAAHSLSYQKDSNVGIAYERRGVPIGPRANSYWLYIVPWGIYKSVNYIKERYGNPTVILAENGMDQAGNLSLHESLHDDTRIKYYRSYLGWLKKGIDEGANVVGYFQWTFVDNFEWRLGYTSRFGIVYVDFKTLRRYPKMAAYWFKKFQERR